jgi:hypothetical protein
LYPSRSRSVFASSTPILRAADAVVVVVVVVVVVRGATTTPRRIDARARRRKPAAGALADERDETPELARAIAGRVAEESIARDVVADVSIDRWRAAARRRMDSVEERNRRCDGANNNFLFAPAG